VAFLVRAQKALLYFGGQSTVFFAVFEAVEAVVLVLEVLGAPKATSI
jgi:hypothetical protein